jgi:hypothetical protein
MGCSYELFDNGCCLNCLHTRNIHLFVCLNCFSAKQKVPFPTLSLLSLIKVMFDEFVYSDWCCLWEAHYFISMIRWSQIVDHQWLPIMLWYNIIDITLILEFCVRNFRVLLVHNMKKWGWSCRWQDKTACILCLLKDSHPIVCLCCKLLDALKVD